MEQQKLIVILDQAGLEAQKINGKFEILTPDNHQAQISKMGKKLSDFNPEDVHKCLLMLLDSPLNREEKLQIYVRTNKNIIIKINQTTRLPRTFNRFCGVFAQLFQKFKITAGDNENKILMQIVNPPVNSYFPENAVVYGVNNNREDFVRPESIVPTKNTKPMVVIITATAERNVMDSCSQFLKNVVSFSNYEMTSEFACYKICNVVYEKWIEDKNGDEK